VPSPLEPRPGAAQPKPKVRKTLDTTKVRKTLDTTKVRKTLDTTCSNDRGEEFRESITNRLRL
jgi:hypothetical protein